MKRTEFQEATTERKQLAMYNHFVYCKFIKGQDNEAAKEDTAFKYYGDCNKWSLSLVQEAILFVDSIINE